MCIQNVYLYLNPRSSPPGLGRLRVFGASWAPKRRKNRAFSIRGHLGARKRCSSSLSTPLCVEINARGRFRGHCASKSLLELAFEATVQRNGVRKRCSSSLSRPLCIEINARGRCRGHCMSKSLLELAFEATVLRNRCLSSLSKCLCIEITARLCFRFDGAFEITARLCIRFDCAFLGRECVRNRCLGFA